MLSIVKHFHLEIKVQFTCTIKVFKSYNALEYSGALSDLYSFYAWCITYLILACTQQNEVAERKIPSSHSILSYVVSH